MEDKLKEEEERKRKLNEEIQEIKLSVLSNELEGLRRENLRLVRASEEKDLLNVRALKQLEECKKDIERYKSLEKTHAENLLKLLEEKQALAEALKRRKLKKEQSKAKARELENEKDSMKEQFREIQKEFEKTITL